MSAMSCRSPHSDLMSDSERPSAVLPVCAGEHERWWWWWWWWLRWWPDVIFVLRLVVSRDRSMESGDEWSLPG